MSRDAASIGRRSMLSWVVVATGPIYHCFGKLWSLARPQTFDALSEAGRSCERNRRVLLTAGASLGARGLGFAVTLVTVPMTVNYLGRERFGLWMTISSLVAMLSFSDLGLGNGLMNAVSHAHGNDDRSSAQRAVSSAFILLVAIAAALGAVFILAYRFVPWKILLNLSDPVAVGEAGPAAAAFVFCYLAGLPLSVVRQVQNGYQEGFANSIWQGLGSLLTVIFLLLAIKSRVGLPGLVLALSGAPLVAGLANHFALFHFRCIDLQPRLRNFSRTSAVELFHLGIMFLSLQIGGVLAFSSQNVIIAQVYGPEAVTDYAIPQRLFQTIIALVSLFVAPLWPAFGEAIARCDLKWIRRTLINISSLNLAITASATLFPILFAKQVLSMWVGRNVTVNLWLIVGFGAWSIVSSVFSPTAMFLNGASIFRPQILASLLFGLMSVSFGYLAAVYIGPSGVIWACLITYIITHTPIYLSVIGKELVSS